MHLQSQCFISTIIEIAQHYNLSRESFFWQHYASFQEAHNNYFEDLEEKLLIFQSFSYWHQQQNFARGVDSSFEEEYGYTIQELFSEQEECSDLRSIFVPQSVTVIRYWWATKAFILAKEIAYNYLEIKDRLFTFSW
jgi:hypothetical protein